MKIMKATISILPVLLVLFSTPHAKVKTAQISAPTVGCVTCETGLDTVTGKIADSLKKWAVEPVDSFKAAKSRQVDSLKTVYDSLCVELKAIERNSNKKLVLGRIDTAYSPTEIHVWYWYYWRFPDGERQFYKCKIKKLQL